MHMRRAALLGAAALGSLGLAACSSGPSSTATTTDAVPTTAAAIGGQGGLCSDIAAFAKQEQGLVTAAAAGGSSGSVSALRSYAKQSKGAFDRIAPRITDDLASAPEPVRSAWTSLVPQLDELYEAGATATSVAGYNRAAGSIESTTGFIAANAALSTYAKAACLA
jgi:hypothetical protein